MFTVVEGLPAGVVGVEASGEVTGNDYASVLILQQSLRVLPQGLNRAYEAAYGEPLHPETLATRLRVIALTIEGTARREGEPGTLG